MSNVCYQNVFDFHSRKNKMIWKSMVPHEFKAIQDVYKRFVTNQGNEETIFNFVWSIPLTFFKLPMTLIKNELALMETICKWSHIFINSLPWVGVYSTFECNIDIYISPIVNCTKPKHPLNFHLFSACHLMQQNRHQILGW